VLALIQNLNVVELLVIGVVAVLVFGKRLPEVSRQAAVGIAKAKRSLVELRRQSGIDEELREARRSIQEVERNARSEWNAVTATVVPRPAAHAISRGPLEEPQAPEPPVETAAPAPDAASAAAPDAAGVVRREDGVRP
jgi:sec-independent protein translocase protein TatA